MLYNTENDTADTSPENLVTILNPVTTQNLVITPEGPVLKTFYA